MKIPHYDEHGQPLGQVEVDLPDPNRPRPAQANHPLGPTNRDKPWRPVLSAVEPIVDVKMHDLPDSAGAHLALIITIAGICLAAFAALMWVVLGG